MPSLPLARASIPAGESERGGSRSTFAYRFRERGSFSPGEKVRMREFDIRTAHQIGRERAWRNEPAGITIELLCNCQ
jgi:hypothetical protein